MPNPEYVKGKEKEGGRQKGTPNKFSNLKQAFLDVFEQIEKEGCKDDATIKTLFKWATKNDRNQAIFYQMISKMLPANLSIDADFNMTYVFSQEFFKPPEIITIPVNGGDRVLEAHEDK